MDLLQTGDARCRLAPSPKAFLARVRGRLQRIGLLRESGHEHFAGSLVIPVVSPEGLIGQVYGRKVTDRLRKGTPLHLYLPGPLKGVFNEEAVRCSEEIILCEALIDALTFWTAGFRHVTAAFGAGGVTDELLAALEAGPVKRVLIAFDRDAAGDAGAAKLAPHEFRRRVSSLPEIAAPWPLRGGAAGFDVQTTEGPRRGAGPFYLVFREQPISRISAYSGFSG